jgi:hypothetical protein
LQQGTHSCSTCAAATKKLPPTNQPTTGSESPSTRSHPAFDYCHVKGSRCPDQLTQHRAIDTSGLPRQTEARVLGASLRTLFGGEVSLAGLYRDAWTEKFELGKGWLANWWPGSSVALGQRGVIRNGQLQFQGYVADYGVSFDLDPRQSPTAGAWDFSSSKETKWAVGTDATAPGWDWLGQAKAGLAVNFGNEESLVFSAADACVERVSDVDKLQADLKKSALDSGMPIGQSVVVERQLATKALLLVSAGRSGELKATASGAINGPTAAGTIASLAGHLDIKSQTGGTSKQDFPSGMVLGFRVVTLGRKGWFWWRHVVAEAVDPVGDASLAVVHEDDLDEDDDYFVELA